MVIVENPSITPDLLAWLSQDEDRWIRTTVIAHNSHATALVALR